MQEHDQKHGAATDPAPSVTGTTNHPIQKLDKLLDSTGRWLTPLPLILVCVQFIAVLMVYVFGRSSIQLQESLQYINAMMIFGAAGYTALHDEHVRVDLFYARFNERGRAWVSLFGSIVLLVPFLALFWYSTIPYVLSSWAEMEGSVETSGLPFVYILKSLLLLFPLTLSLSVVADILRATSVLKKTK